jgi:hypothetical protein
MRASTSHHPRQLAAARLGEHVVKPRLRRAFGERAGGRPRPVNAGPIFF